MRMQFSMIDAVAPCRDIATCMYDYKIFETAGAPIETLNERQRRDTLRQGH